MTIIKVNKIYKSFNLYNSKFDKLKFIVAKKKVKKFFGIKNVSFKINKGQHLGILGKNGSGKSTLLKILSKIMIPDKGSLEINGKLFSILELGLGFNDDLTGRENIRFSYQLYNIEKHLLIKCISFLS